MVQHSIAIELCLPQALHLAASTAMRPPAKSVSGLHLLLPSALQRMDGATRGSFDYANGRVLHGHDRHGRGAKGTP